MSEILSGGLNWGSTQQAIVTMDKEGHPLSCCNPVTGECLGGGGSSDFSTAEMLTHITVTGEVLPFAVAMLHGFMIDDNGWLDAVELTTSENRTVKVPLYHQINDTIFAVPSSNAVETFTVEKVSGDVTITQNEDGYAISVEGNCEININIVIHSV